MLLWSLVVTLTLKEHFPENSTCDKSCSQNSTPPQNDPIILWADSCCFETVLEAKPVQHSDAHEAKSVLLPSTLLTHKAKTVLRANFYYSYV